MTGKYTAAGAGAIYAALSRLITADAAKGLATVVIDIDDPAQVSPFGTAPVINAADESGAKRVIDAIDAAIAPDYFVLLDGPDAIPHISLAAIPGLSDGDPDIPSDLPYACSGGFSREASSFLAVTRVVGRLPMPRGSSDFDAFAALIDLCSTQSPKPQSDHSSYFAMSTDTWKVSTQLNVSTLFGSSASLSVSPTAGHSAIDPALSSLTHLINCHGATLDARFYGQLMRSYPVAMNSPQVAPHVTKGTVAAAECCYGAELFDPILAGAGMPMGMAYLLAGASAYLGSTNIAYGPVSTNGQADLMVQFFIDAILKGASSGRAVLQARQRLVTTQRMSDPRNLKTLAQFLLLGDPSVVPVRGNSTSPEAVPEADTLATAVESKGISPAPPSPADERSGRKARRISLKSEGAAVASAATRLGRPVLRAGVVGNRVRAIATQRGFTGQVDVFDVDGGPAFRQAAKAIGRKQRVAVTSLTEEHLDPNSGTKHKVVRVLVANILGDGIGSMDESVSR